jgi:diguanylate cyclase (GGDEF)-like protein/PAS domain S-box-containing protein
VSTEPASQFAHYRVDARALLGLHDPPDTSDWGPIRAAQLRAGRQFALFLLATNLIGASFVVMTFRHIAPLWQLVGWAVLVGIVATTIAIRRLHRRHQHAITATVAEVRASAIDGVAMAAVWSVACFVFASQSNAEAGLAFWVTVSILMLAAAVSMAALPLATITFLVLLGSAIAATIFAMGIAPLAGAALIYTALLVNVCYVRGRSLVVIRADRIALSERDETVSMLLREFDAEDDGDWLWEIDAQRRVVRASPRFATSIGVDPKAINGMGFLEILAGPTWADGNFSNGLRAIAEHLKRREAFRDLLLPVYVDGQERWWEMTASPRYADDGKFLGFRGVGSDVTEARQSADKISRMARFDALTGLPNRLLINETLAKAMADAEQWGARCAFMMIDLDRFKAVNDTLGHPIGDRLLGRVSERLARLITENEMIGRLGGDEFAVVVRDAGDQHRVMQLAKTIVETLSRPYEIDHHTLYIGASIGIAFGPRDGRTAEMLIRSSDLALYRSKDAGGGHVHVYEPQLHVEAEERRVLEIALRNALENDELHLTYQPVVDADTGGLTGFETLLRWTHPELGPISPAKFVPLAEDARLIAPIGEWVLRNACAEAATWDDDVRIAVNVSAEQLHSASFVNLVTQTLAQSGLHPSRLELEVTESVFLREGTSAVSVLEKLLDLGVRLSLDDFGTGYSSLGYLSRTRFSTIKIDRSFVQSASKGEKEAIAIIRAVVALAQSLGMATTAEGVETEQEHLMIRELGCTKVQGYYFGRPLPVAEARSLAITRSTNNWAAA